MTAKQKAKPIATLLNKSDALIFAADELDRRVADMELVSILSSVMKDIPAEKDADGSARDALSELRVMASGIVDKDLQISAMKSAAEEIRALANETKLAEARANRDGIKVGL